MTGKKHQESKPDALRWAPGFDMDVITTRKGERILVDAGDYERLNKFTWHVLPNGYAATTVRKPDGRQTKVTMHRMVMGISDPSVKVDHKHGVKLDNRRSELRVATTSQNGFNKGIQRNSATWLKGVYRIKNTSRFLAQITLNGKSTHVGSFDTAIEAARAYDLAAIGFHGDFAKTNEMLGLIGQCNE